MRGIAAWTAAACLAAPAVAEQLTQRFDYKPSHQGNVVAAGSGGTRVGWLWPGERDTSTIRFPYVYRNFDKAKSFLITMEVEKK